MPWYPSARCSVLNSYILLENFGLWDSMAFCEALIILCIGTCRCRLLGSASGHIVGHGKLSCYSVFMHWILPQNSACHTCSNPATLHVRDNALEQESRCGSVGVCAHVKHGSCAACRGFNVKHFKMVLQFWCMYTKTRFDLDVLLTAFCLGLRGCVETQEVLTHV